MVMVIATLALSPLATMGPRHTHDCECCRFLGRLDHSGGPTKDIYVHQDEDGDGDTLILREGSDGPEYASFPVGSARRVAEKGISVDWRVAVTAYEAWVEAGKPS